MGRAPCCDKANVKKGPWSPEEDAKLKSYIEKHGTGGNWIALPQKIGLKRCGKSCRLRWLNYLRPNIKHGGFSEEEDNIICSLYISIGSRWSIIAAQLPGRTDNDIKNYWNTRLKKKLLGKQRKEHAAARRGIGKKQEMKRERENQSMFCDNNYQNIQNPYWPEMPTTPYSTQELRFNDHVSMRKLLIKLGGRFSDDGQTINGVMNPQFPLNIEDSINFLSPAPMDHPLNTTAPPLPNTAQYNMDGEAGMAILPAGRLMEEMVFNNPERLDGMEFLYGNYTCGDNMDWGEMSSLVYPPLASNGYEGLQQGSVLQGCAFEELRYPAAQ